MSTNKQSCIRSRLTSCGVLFLFIALVIQSMPAIAIDNVSSGAALNVTYRFDESVFSLTAAQKARVNDAASEWTNRAAGSIQYSSSSSNRVFLYDIAAIANATLPCDGSGCVLRLNWEYAFYDLFHSGTGTNPGVADCGFPWYCPYDGMTRYDLWGVVTHEMGHWRGLNHDLFGTCNGNSLYSPYPTREAATMCYTPYDPAIEGGSGDAGIAPRRTISQDEIQGVADLQSNHFVANNSFTICPGCAWDDAPEFWWFSPGSSHWWGSGTVSLNNNAAVPYPEIRQRIRGADADRDNDGRFYVIASVKAVHSDVTPRAVIFVRHSNGTYEKTCDSGVLTVGAWRTFSCTLDLTNSATLEFEYGVRVTEKIDIAWVLVRDT